MTYLSNKLIYLTAVLFIVIATADAKLSRASSAAKNLSIVVNIENIRCCEGAIILGLYNRKSTWLKPAGMVRSRLSIANAEQQRIEIHGLSAGEYAIAVFQDLNQNRKLDRRFGLASKEPHGFSGVGKGWRGVSYSKAAFTLDSDTEMTIRLIDRKRRKKESANE